MAEGVKVRRMVREDCATVLSLIKELENSESESTLKLRDLHVAGFDGEPSIYSGFVAEEESSGEGSSKKKGLKMVGVALIHFKYSTWEGPVLHLNTIVVASGRRRNGVGRALMKALAKMAVDKKSSRISLEVDGGNEGALQFFLSLGALNLTKEEGWLNYSFSPQAVQKLVKDGPPQVDGVTIRPTVPKDCSRIHDMILELAEFEKMPDGPKLTPKDHERNGFFKLHPDFHSFVAEHDGDIIGFTIFFVTFDYLCGKKIHLEDLYVTPKQRTKGVGEMLFKAVGKFVEEGNYHGFTLEVLDWNSKAIQFYDKFDGSNDSTGSRKLQSIRFRMENIRSLAN